MNSIKYLNIILFRIIINIIIIISLIIDYYLIIYISNNLLGKPDNFIFLYYISIRICIIRY